MLDVKFGDDPFLSYQQDVKIVTSTYCKTKRVLILVSMVSLADAMLESLVLFFYPAGIRQLIQVWLRSQAPKDKLRYMHCSCFSLQSLELHIFRCQINAVLLKVIIFHNSLQKYSHI